MTILSKIKDSIKRISSKKLLKKDKVIKKDESSVVKEFAEIEELERKLKPKHEVYKPNFLTLRSSYTFWIMWAIIVYVWYVMYQWMGILYLVFTAYILSIAVEAIIDLFTRYMNRWLSIVISYLLIFWLILSWFILIVPFFMSQSAELWEIVISKVREYQVALEKENWFQNIIKNSSIIPKFAKEWILNSIKDPKQINNIQQSLKENIANIVSYGTDYFKKIWSWVVAVITGFFSALLQILLVFMLAIFFSLEKDWVINFLSAFSKNKEYFAIKMKKLYKQLWFRLKWQLLLTIFIWLTVRILLRTLSFISFIDMPSKLTLALIAWATEFIPMVWPIIWAIPAVIVAVTKFWITWFIVIWLMYYSVQLFENNVLVPVVMNKALWLSPLLIFIAILLWWSVLWFVWIVLSVPIAVIATLVFEEFTGKE